MGLNQPTPKGKGTLLQKLASETKLRRPDFGGLAAYRGMKLKTHLGNIGLIVEASAKADAGERLAELAMQNLIFHKAPAVAFKKDSGFKREDAHSDALAKQVEASIRASIETLFDVQGIETSSYVKETSKADQAIAAERQKAFNALAGLDAKLAASLYPEFAPGKIEEGAKLAAEE